MILALLHRLAPCPHEGPRRYHEGRAATLERGQTHYIDQGLLLKQALDASRKTRNLFMDDTLHLRADLARQEAVLAQALQEKADLTARVLVLEEDVRTATRSADNLMDIADGLRDALEAAETRARRRTRARR